MRCPALAELPPPPPGKLGWPWTVETPSIKSKQPRISIVTASYNQGKYIEETIRSILLQGYPNIEYVIVDGGSTDETVEIIKKYAPWLSHWVSEPDRGQAHAINKGLNRTTGEILAWLNSDDLYLKGAFQRVGEHFSCHPDTDLAHGRCREVDWRGKEIGERTGSLSTFSEIVDLWDVWWRKRNFVQPEVFWTRRIMNQIGLLEETLYWSMDYEYWLRVLHAGGEVGFIDEALACFRIHSDQKSTQPEQTASEMLQVVHPYIFAPGHSLPWFKKLELSGRWIFHAKFIGVAAASRLAGEGRVRRWRRLGWLAARYPQMFLARGFQDRISGAVSRLLGIK